MRPLLFKRRISGGCSKLGLLAACFLLMVILFPWGWSIPRWKARQVSCISNLKQIGYALTQYSQDYDDHYPPAEHWSDLMLASAHIQNPHMDECPEHLPDHPPFTYAFNREFSKQLPSARTDRADRPLVFDSNSTQPNALSDGLSDLASPPRHNGGNILLFADLHVKWRKYTHKSAP